MTPAAPGSTPNRLALARSPYLLQHARNPVDWYPWGDEAFEKARREEKPIFLSIGYSTCHWCHVMEHESFVDEDVARFLNERFVALKVDREERPDVDDVYMTVTQVLSGHGGWPMSVFLTPEKKPFFAGTYFPRRGRQGMPGFLDLLQEIDRLWRTRRDDVLSSAERISEAAAQASLVGPIPPERAHAGELPGPDVLAHRVARELGARFDPEHGGFGHAPKFPPHQALRLLVEERETLGPDAFGMATTTLEAMAAGGIRDHLGGGFARYSTDEHWLVPHFEKMLYDNAMLARVYAVGHEAVPDRGYGEVARSTLDFVLREMTSAEGAFFSALDADSEGEEGKFYVWKPAEVEASLGKEDADLFGEVYGVSAGGNFEHGTSILHLRRPATAVAREFKLAPAVLEARLAGLRERLFRARAARVRPGLDDKVLVSWNGLAIGAFATAGRVLGEPRYVEAARRAASFILERLRRPDGRLAASYRGEPAPVPAFLDDAAFLADGLLDLAEAEATAGDEEAAARWLGAAREQVDRLTADFLDRERGGFFATSAAHETLLFRAKEGFDGALPGGNGVAARALVRLAAATGEIALAQRARETFEAFKGSLVGHPGGAVTLVHAYLRWGYLTGNAARPSETRAAAGAGGGGGGGGTGAGDEPLRVQAGPVAVEASMPYRIAAGQAAELRLLLRLAPGVHVYASDPGSRGSGRRRRPSRSRPTCRWRSARRPGRRASSRPPGSRRSPSACIAGPPWSASPSRRGRGPSPGRARCGRAFASSRATTAPVRRRRRRSWRSRARSPEPVLECSADPWLSPPSSA